MQYNRSITLRDGRLCRLRNGVAADSEAVLASFLLTRRQTDFLLTYPDEVSFTAEQEGQFLQGKADSPDEVLIIAEVDGAIAGTAGVDALGRRDKVRHRAVFGISLDKAYCTGGWASALRLRPPASTAPDRQATRSWSWKWSGTIPAPSRSIKGWASSSAGATRWAFVRARGTFRNSSPCVLS